MSKQAMQRVSERLNIPTEILTQEPVVTIHGNHHVAIDHHRSVLDYTKQRIQVSTRNDIISVVGSDLTIILLTRTRMEIRGRISSVELE